MSRPECGYRGLDWEDHEEIQQRIAEVGREKLQQMLACGNELTDHQLMVLMAAREHADALGYISQKTLANATGLTGNAVALVVRQLRRKHRWPYTFYGRQPSNV